MNNRDEAVALDRDDPLGALRDQFALPTTTIYLDGNSLGVPPAAAAQRAQTVIAAEWGEGLIRSWNSAGWFALPRRLGNKLAPLIGAARQRSGRHRYDFDQPVQAALGCRAAGERSATRSGA